MTHQPTCQGTAQPQGTPGLPCLASMQSLNITRQRGKLITVIATVQCHAASLLTVVPTEAVTPRPTFHPEDAQLLEPSVGQVGLG